MRQKIRIIGGLFRGRKINVPDVEGLRPTPDRVRETLFNWITPYVRGAHCLDAFAGTGALGIEALSRGASKTTSLELNAKAFIHLKNQKKILGLTNLVVLQKNAVDLLKHPLEPYDIIFLDPPFDTELLDKCITLIEKQNVLKKGGILYTESNHKISLQSENWHPLKAQHAGVVYYSLYQKKI